MKSKIPGFITELNETPLSIQDDKELFLYLNRIVSFSYSAIVLDSVLKKGKTKTREEFDTNYVTTNESTEGLGANPNANYILKKFGIKTNSISSNYYANLDKFPFSLPNFYLENLMSLRDNLVLDNAVSLLSGDHSNNLHYWINNFEKFFKIKNNISEYVPLFSKNIDDSVKLMVDIRKMSNLKMNSEQFFEEKNIKKYLNLALTSYILLDRFVEKVSEDLQQKIYEYYKPKQLKNR